MRTQIKARRTFAKVLKDNTNTTNNTNSKKYQW